MGTANREYRPVYPYKKSSAAIEVTYFFKHQDGFMMAITGFQRVYHRVDQAALMFCNPVVLLIIASTLVGSKKADMDE